MKTYFVIFADDKAITRFAESKEELIAMLAEEFPNRAIKEVKELTE